MSLRRRVECTACKENPSNNGMSRMNWLFRFIVKPWEITITTEKTRTRPYNVYSSPSLASQSGWNRTNSGGFSFWDGSRSKKNSKDWRQPSSQTHILETQFPNLPQLLGVWQDISNCGFSLLLIWLGSKEHKQTTNSHRRSVGSSWAKTTIGESCELRVLGQKFCKPTWLCNSIHFGRVLGMSYELMTYVMPNGDDCSAVTCNLVIVVSAECWWFLVEDSDTAY